MSPVETILQAGKEDISFFWEAASDLRRFTGDEDAAVELARTILRALLHEDWIRIYACVGPTLTECRPLSLADGESALDDPSQWVGGRGPETAAKFEATDAGVAALRHHETGRIVLS